MMSEQTASDFPLGARVRWEAIDTEALREELRSYQQAWMMPESAALDASDIVAEYRELRQRIIVALTAEIGDEATAERLAGVVLRAL